MRERDDSREGAPIQAIEFEPSTGFGAEVDTATDCHVNEAIEAMHVALMVAKPRPTLVDLDDEITNVVRRFG